MSCVITYKGQKYSEEQFKEYFINNKQEFATSIAKNKDVIDSFKRKMEGIDFVFSQSPELASIGSKAQYLQYLSTIFKTSKVKDIVYRGGNLGTKQPQDVEAFTTNKSYAEYRAEQNNTKVFPAILNIKESKLLDKKETRTLSLDRDEFQYQDYGFTDNKDQTKQLGNFYTVKETNRHILGSKQDIQGFKDFVSKKINNNKADESINERLMRYEESIKIPNNVKSKVLEKIEKETEKVKEKLLSLGLKQDNNKFELITNSYATFKMKLKELENVNAIISTNKTSDFYQIIARLKNTDSTMELKKQGELPFTPIEVKQVIQEQQFLNDVADNVFEGLSEEEKQILKKKIENGDYDLNCRI